MNENVQRYFNSKGHKKLRLYFEDIVKKESFQKKIKELRKILGKEPISLLSKNFKIFKFDL